MWPATSCCLITHGDRSVLNLVSLQNSLPWQWKRQHWCIHGCPLATSAHEKSWVWWWTFGKSKCHPGKMLDYASACLYIILQSRPISTRRGFTISEKCIANEDPNVNPYFSLTFLEGMKDAVHATKKKVGPNKFYRIACVVYISYSDDWKWRPLVFGAHDESVYIYI